MVKSERLLGCSAILFILLLPIFWLPLTFESWELPKLFWLFFAGLLLSLAILSKELKNKSFRIFWPFDALVSAFLLISFLSALFSIDKISSLFGFYAKFSDGLIALAGFGLAYFVVSRMAKENWQKMVKALLVSGFLSAVIAWLSLMGLMTKLFGLAGSFNPVSPSLENLAVFLAPLVFLALSFEKIEKISFVFIAVSAGLFLTVAYLPSLIVLGLVSFLWLAFLFVKKGKNLFIENRNLALCLILLLAVSFIAAKFDIFANVLNFPREVTLGYTQSWQIAFDSLKSKLLLGSGPGTFFHNFAKFKKANFNLTPLWQIRFDRPLGYFAELLSTTGILGFLAYAAMLVFALKSKKFVFPLLAVLIGQALYYQNMAFGFAFWVIFALIGGLKSEEKKISLTPRFLKMKKDSVKKRIIMVASCLFFSIALMLMIFVGTRIYLADHYYGSASKMAAGADKTALLQKAVSINPYFPEYRIILGRAFLNQAVNELQKPEAIKNIKVILNMIAESAQSLKKATDISPHWVAGWETTGFVYQQVSDFVSGADDWAISSFKKAIELEPTNPLLYFNLGQVYFSQGELELAKDQFSQSVILKPDFLEPRIFLALIKEKQGNAKAALNSMIHLRQNYPLSPDIAFQLGRLYFNQKKTDQAMVLFQEVLNMVPNHLDSLYSMALALERQGKKTEAIPFLEKALQISPNSKAIKDKLSKLR